MRCGNHKGRRYNDCVLIGIDASRIDAAQLTGTERYAREVIRALLRIAPQHQFRLYVRTPEALDDLLATYPNAEGVHIDQARLWTHLGLGREMTTRPPEALFIPAHVLPTVNSKPVIGAQVRSVVTVHDCGFVHFPNAHTTSQRLYLNWSTRFAAKHAHVLIADSEATLQDLSRHFPASTGKVRVAYPGLTPLPPTTPEQIERACLRYDLRPGAFALHVGTLQPRKNLKRLIEAWGHALPRLGGSARLVLCGGPGWGGEDLAAEVAKRGLRGSVTLTGYISDEDKSALMHSSRAYLFPSLHEGFGFPVLEAQSAGVPVACSNTSSLPEVAGEAAVFFDPQQPLDITSAIVSVMTHESLRQSLIAAGRQNAARFSWDACASAVLEALTDEGPTS